MLAECHWVEKGQSNGCEHFCNILFFYVKIHAHGSLGRPHDLATGQLHTQGMCVYVCVCTTVPSWIQRHTGGLTPCCNSFICNCCPVFHDHHLWKIWTFSHMSTHTSHHQSIVHLAQNRQFLFSYIYIYWSVYCIYSSGLGFNYLVSQVCPIL